MLKLDGDIDHYRSVIVSLQAKVARREESLVHLRSTLALRTQELVQTKNDLEQTMEIATTQNGSAYSAARPSDAVARTKASHSAGRAACLEVNAATLPASVGYVCGFPPHLAYGLAAQLSGLPLHGVHLMASAHACVSGGRTKLQLLLPRAEAYGVARLDPGGFPPRGRSLGIVALYGLSARRDISPSVGRSPHLGRRHQAPDLLSVLPSGRGGAVNGWGEVFRSGGVLGGCV